MPNVQEPIFGDGDDTDVAWCKAMDVMDDAIEYLEALAHSADADVRQAIRQACDKRGVTL